MAQIVSQTKCRLGEGPLWHPKRKALFWFDILNHILYELADGSQRAWTFDRAVSAAGWVDETRLLIASERDLFVFDLETQEQTHLVALEADNPATRSNDGRADPMGGFWIGTMNYDPDAGAGAIYRYFMGEIRQIYPNIRIPNAICFSPDGRYAYFTDTPTGIIQRVALDEHGWPSGAPAPWLDLRGDGVNPDGAVIDAQGNMWNAQWGAGRVACYDPSGVFVTSIPVPARHSTCPSFGGPDLSDLYVTSATEGTASDDVHSGKTFVVATSVNGQAEHRVILPDG